MRPLSLGAAFVLCACFAGQAATLQSPSQGKDAGGVGKRSVIEETRQEQRRKIERFRREYVRPAPAGFVPGEAKRAITLTLVPEKTTIKVGDRLKYRLEVQNVGREKLFFYEYQSFVRTGVLQNSSKYKFYLTPPDGKEIRLERWYRSTRGGIDFGGFEYNPPGWSKLTDKQKEIEIARLNKEAGEEFELEVSIFPGEILYTKPWNGPGTFRELKATPLFDAPGVYHLRAVYDDPPPPPRDQKELEKLVAEGLPREVILRGDAESARKALGRVQSNVLSIEVVL